MDYIQELKTTKDKVADLLKGYPELRDASPTVLIVHYWKHFNDLDITGFLPQLENSETVRRARQLLAEKDPQHFGPLNEDVRQARLDKEEQYHEELKH